MIFVYVFTITFVDVTLDVAIITSLDVTITLFVLAITFVLINSRLKFVYENDIIIYEKQEIVAFINDVINNYQIFFVDRDIIVNILEKK